MYFKEPKTSKKIRDYNNNRYKENKELRESMKKANERRMKKLRADPKLYEQFLKKQREWNRKYQKKKLHIKRLEYAKFYQWCYRNRKKILIHYNKKCQFCKKENNDLELHHICYENNIFNIKPLCKECHQKIHKYNLKWCNGNFI